MESLADISKTLTLTFVFLIISPLVILASLTTLSHLYRTSSTLTNPSQALVADSLLPATAPEGTVLASAVETGDARVFLLTEYLNRYHSPLSNQATDIVKISDIYNLDYRLLVAIAQQESNLCKIIPVETYNCWGWGIHSQGTLGFSSYKEAYHAVAKGLREEYLDKGYTTPDEIMTKYTPSSPGTWARGVNQFMEEIENPAS